MKKLIVRISEGLGNQLFIYAFSYALSKELNYELSIDNTSAYFKKKNQIRNYELNKFNIYSKICDPELKFDNTFSDFKRNILIKFDNFKSNKSFLVENKNNNKLTSYQNYFNNNYANLLYLEGHFECEKFFINYSTDIKKQFVIKNDFVETDNQYVDEIKKSNSVSICIRQHRFSERGFSDLNKSNKFTLDTITYVKKSIKYFENKISNPKFFIWSNDFKNLSNHFDPSKFVFIENDKNKSINDFNLFKYSKNFIVGPTTFHWWGAWLNNNPNKICVRPSNLNPSNNKDFWPDKWICI